MRSDFWVFEVSYIVNSKDKISDRDTRSMFVDLIRQRFPSIGYDVFNDVIGKEIVDVGYIVFTVCSRLMKSEDEVHRSVRDLVQSVFGNQICILGFCRLVHCDIDSHSDVHEDKPVVHNDFVSLFAMIRDSLHKMNRINTYISSCVDIVHNASLPKLAQYPQPSEGDLKDSLVNGVNELSNVLMYLTEMSCSAGSNKRISNKDNGDT